MYKPGDDNTILIVNATMAKYLLKQGFIITDLKPHKFKEHASVFVFRYEAGMDEAIKAYKRGKI